MRDKIKEAIERGQAKREAFLEADRLVAQERAEKAEREERQRQNAYREVASAWVAARLAREIEDATARGERFLDVTKISYDLRCTDKILAQAIADAGVEIWARSQEDCDYESGRPLGTYTTDYKAVW